eukprot:scaffold1913_cov151-Skeletonema_dohrnii-CCMP3373.AAC.6
MSSSRSSLLSARSSTTATNKRSVDYNYEIVSIEEECQTSDDGEENPPCFSLLQQFYDELMIPNFPIEEQRDDIDDWLECFRLQMKQRHQLHKQKQQEDAKQALTEVIQEEGIVEEVQKLSHATIADDGEFDGAAMDVVLMILDEGYDGDDSNNDVTTANTTGRFSRRESSRIRMSMYGGLYAPKSDQDAKSYSNGNKPVIIGGAAVEYYKKSRAGLVSYMVLRDEFRGCGLTRYLQEEALSRLENLANVYGASFQKERNRQSESTTLLQAVFAEANTAEAGDVSPEQILQRHNSLYNLGYRLVSFPYSQPPLTTEDVDGSFDENVLLTYFPFDENTVRTARNVGEYSMRYCQWFSQQEASSDAVTESRSSTQMNVVIPFLYVEDFYQRVFGYDTSNDSEAKKVKDGIPIPDYRTAKYYKLVHWFTRHRKGNGSGSVNVSLDRPPWNDCKEIIGNEYKENLALDGGRNIRILSRL